MTLKDGRWFTFGTQEVVVGTSITEQFQKASIGDRIAFGGTSWTIVGVIDGQGTAFDSEVWGDVDQIMSVFNRPVYSIAPAPAAVRRGIRRDSNSASSRTRAHPTPR